MFTYRDIIKDKAEALAYAAEFGSQDEIKHRLHDLADFAKTVAFKLRAPAFSLGQDFYDDLAVALEAG